jgi:hypothetical protein
MTTNTEIKASERSKRIAAALSVIKQDYSPDCLRMASTADYVADAVGQLIDAGLIFSQPVGAVVEDEVMRDALLNIRDYRTDVDDTIAARSMRFYAEMALASQPAKPADVGGVVDEGHLNDHHILRMAGGKLAFDTQGGLITFARKVIAESRAAFHRESPCVEENLKAVLGERAVENMKNSRNINLTFEKAAKLMAAPTCKYPDCTCHWAYGQGLVCNAEQRAALAVQTAAPVDLIQEIMRDPCFSHLHLQTKEKCRALLAASKG